jgi:hypothetical protein
MQLGHQLPQKSRRKYLPSCIEEKASDLPFGAGKEKSGAFAPG